ncbi:hypothetical protein IWQ61_004423 [Dispira simplex]|nr:hypothetical protein IWQ61_004423 [Dispira simplex]
METTEVGLIPHNRGQKLKQGAERVSQSRRLWTRVTGDLGSAALWSLPDGVRSTTIEAAAEAEVGLAEDGELTQPRLVAITDKVLQPLDPHENILARSTVRRTLLGNNYLELLASGALDMVAQENQFNKRLRQLQAVLLDDDPLFKATDNEDDHTGRPPSVPKVTLQLQQVLAQSNEFMQRLHGVRGRLVRIMKQRRQVSRRLRWMAMQQGLLESSGTDSSP